MAVRFLSSRLFDPPGLKGWNVARLPRVEIFSPDEVAIVHVMNRVVRRCFLLGDDPVTGKNYDHRKQWIEDLLKRFAAELQDRSVGICNSVESLSSDFQVSAGCGLDLE